MPTKIFITAGVNADITVTNGTTSAQVLWKRQRLITNVIIFNL